MGIFLSWVLDGDFCFEALVGGVFDQGMGCSYNSSGGCTTVILRLVDICFQSLVIPVSGCVESLGGLYPWV